MRVTKVFTEFFESEKSGGLILIACTLLSLLLSNSDYSTEYLSIWHLPFFDMPLEYWINDGLMAIFFLLIGLELEREVYIGELSNRKDALFPLIAAIGGMMVPAVIYLLLNYGTVAQSGLGIPMATDIAFALGVLSLLGKRVPFSLKVFLTALAVIDDLGAILVIALFYTKTLVWMNLIYASIILLALFILNRLKVMSMIPYLVGGAFMWHFMLHSGVHPTITGVLIAFVIPFGSGGANSISYRLQHFLHKPVAFLILPLFALANTAIIIHGSLTQTMSESYTLGIALGLICGKPLGIALFTYLGVKLNICVIPKDIHWKQITGVGLLAGIGFTMSIFITLLAFDNAEMINHSKIAILVASLCAGIMGYCILLLNVAKKKTRPSS